MREAGLGNSSAAGALRWLALALRPLAPRPLARRFSLALLALAAACGGPKPLAWESAPPGSPDLSKLACVAAQDPPPADFPRYLADLAALRVQRVRREVPWAWLERTRGTFDFGAWDGNTEALGAAGLEQIVTLDYGNALYNGRTDGDDKYPAPPADFARYASALVQRWKPWVTRWEIWNEPNAGFRFWKPAADAAAFAATLDAAAAAVRDACPACEVILGAPVSIGYPGTGVPSGAAFVGQVAALSSSFDSAAAHLYTLYPPCSPPEGGPNRCGFFADAETPFSAQASSLRAAAGRSGLHVTELGWPSWKSISGKGDVTEGAQAAWLLRGTLLAAAAGAVSACWYTWSDDARSGGFPPEGDFGLVHRDGSHKPAFDAFAALYAVPLRGFIRSRETELGLRAGEHALLFETAGGLVTWLWREESAAPRTVQVPLHSSGPARSIALDPKPAALTEPR